MKLAALLGHPLEHSRSPQLHNAAFTHFGIDARYELWDTGPADLAARVAALREPHMFGANVTLPYKQAVLQLLDQIDPLATQVGAVNTIIREADGSLSGINTDVPAFLAALREDAGFDPAGRRAVVLGASGAARAAVAALLEARIASIVVVNRTLERAEELLGDALLNATYDPELLAATTADDLRDALAEADLIVNATSLGWHAEETPLGETFIPPKALVYDMVYRQTRLLRDAAASGARTQDGWTMLARQAALAFAGWTGEQGALPIMMQLEARPA
ncbi:MAG: shikimate dehydrogenase [Roseiflexaceae bacterium]|nr:shikimate dehydrogenase [Roseiflexaceae bacterium]